MFHLTKKRAVAMAVVGSLALSAGAYAYWTSVGSGTTTTSVGTSAAVTITKVHPILPLSPGTSSPIVVTATNSGPGAQRVGTVKLDRVVVTGTGTEACDPTWFTMADIPINETVPGNSTSPEKNGSLVMENTATDQNACKGATLTLHFSSTEGAPPTS